MKKVAIVEDHFDGRESVADLCSHWPDDIEIFVAEEEKQGTILIRENKVDLIICNLSSGYGPQLSTLADLTYTFPYIPLIALTDKEQNLSAEVLQRGATVCLKSPVSSADLRLEVHKLFEDSTSGAVKGIPVHSLLQMLETDEKNCTLIVKKDERVGLLFLEDGKISGAETEDQVNEDAFFSIVTWEDAHIEIKQYNRQRTPEINQSLISLIMEAFRLKDERESLEYKQETDNKPKLELKHFSTAGSRLSLDVGAKIKMEINGEESELMSTMVGMVPQDFLIVETPKPYDLTEKLLDKKQRIVVKYLNMGRLCIFKTLLKERITSPHHLLFLDYPPVVHFHELRRAKRTTIFVPSSLFFNNTELKGVLLDLSSMGCLFTSKLRGKTSLSAFDIDSTVKLSCLLPGVKENQIIAGTVKNIKKTRAELRLGIEFTNLAENLKIAIEKYVRSVESLAL